MGSICRQRKDKTMRLRIFVIDDEQCIRDSFKWHLEDQGHEVLTAPEPVVCDIYKGHDCSEIYPCGDILFVDYNMPRMTGLEFVELMSQRGCKGHPSNKIIMSGDTTTIDMERVNRLGCQVIQKPVTLLRVDEIIDECKSRISEKRRLANLTTKKPISPSGCTP